MLSALLAVLFVVQDDVDARIKDFAEAMKAAKSDADRVAAIQAAGQVRALKMASKLVQVAAGPYAPEVRVAACDAVGRIGDAKSGPALQGVLNSFGGLLSSENPNRAGDQRVAEAVVRAIGSVRDRSAVKQLSGLLISNNIPLMGEICRTLGKLRDPSCLGNLLKLHYAANAPEGVGAQNVRKPLAPDTLAALRKITGQPYTTPDEWNDWYRKVGSSFQPPPEESLPGLVDVRSFAVYTGKGERAVLEKYDLVFLDPANWTKSELGPLKAIALSGDLKAALDKGFAGAVVEAAKAPELRKKFPRALLVVRGPDANAAPHVNAFLLEGVAADDPLLALVKNLRSRHDNAVLAAFVADAKEAPARLKLAKDQGFLGYAAADFAAIAAP
jgi:hypothetical protein